MPEQKRFVAWVLPDNDQTKSPCLLFALRFLLCFGEPIGIAAIDELDAALHPILMTEIFNWFRDKNKNPKNAQLWFTGHAVSSMDDLSMEEILFCEKDPQGRTSVFRARDIARRDDNLRRKYLSGIYGAVPQIG